MLFLVALFSFCSTQSVLFVSPDGNCESTNKCLNESIPCSLVCPFSEGNKRLENNEITIKMFPGEYKLDNYPYYTNFPFYHIMNISRNGLSVIFEPVYSESEVYFKGFPSLPFVNITFDTIVSVFYISGDHVSLTFRDFKIEKLYHEESEDFGGFLFSTTDSPLINRISFENMELQLFAGFFSNIGLDPPFTMANMTIREIFVKNTSFYDVDTPFNLKFTPHGNITKFTLNVVDSTFVHKKTMFNFLPYPYEEHNVDLFGTRSNAFVTIFSDERYHDLPSQIEVNMERTKVINSKIKSVISLVDLGDTQFFLYLQGCEFSKNNDLNGVIYLSLSDVTIDLMDNVISGNIGTDKHSIESILTIDELPLYIAEVYTPQEYHLRITITNFTVCNNDAFSIMNFPFLEIFTMNIRLNITDSYFTDNFVSKTFKDIPLRFSSIFSFTQLTSYTAVEGYLSFSNCIFKKNEDYNYIIYFSTSAGFLPLYGQILKIDDCVFFNNSVKSDVIRYHPLGPEPLPKFVEDSVIMISNTRFEENSGMAILHDKRDKYDYLTNHDFPCLMIVGCYFYHNTALLGGIIHVERIILNEIRGLKIVSTQLVSNTAETGGGIYAENIHVSVRDVLVDSNTAEFGGGLFFVNSILTSLEDTYKRKTKCEGLKKKNIVNITVVNNKALESGGGLYCSECSSNYIDPKVNEKTFIFEDNKMGVSRMEDGLAVNNFLTTPTIFKLNTSTNNECRDRGGYLVWLCSMNQILIEDENGTVFTDSTYEDLTIKLTIYKKEKDGTLTDYRKITFPTSHKDDKYFFFTFYSKDYGIMWRGRKIPVEIEFLGITRRTHLVFAFNYDFYWLIPVSIFLLVACFLICICSIFMYCGCACLVLTCWMSCLKEQKSSGKHKSQFVLEKRFEEYPNDILHRIVAQTNGPSNENTGLLSGLSPGLSEPKFISVEDEILDRGSINSESSTLSGIVISSLGKDFLDGAGGVVGIGEKDQEYFDDIEDEGEMDHPPPLRERRNRKERRIIKLSDHHVFQGDVNSEGRICYFSRKNKMSSKKLPVVFEGFFWRGKKEGPGTEYYRPGVIKFRGMFRNNVRHGRGKNYISKDENRRDEFFLGEWRKSKLYKVIYNNMDLPIYDIKNDVQEVARIYPKIMNEEEEDPEKYPTRLVSGKIVKKEDRYFGKECVVKYFLFFGNRGSIKHKQFIYKIEKLEKILKMLSLFKNDNMITVYGWSGKQWGVPPSYVMENCVGSIIDLIRGDVMLPNARDTSTQFFKLKLLYGIAKGMQFLNETCGIIHRDLKSSNVLIDQLGNVRVCDFELAVMSKEDWVGELNNEGAAGSPFHCAPEVLNNENFDISCDVYSFGILMYEILNEERLDDPYGINEERLHYQCHVCGETVGSEKKRMMKEMIKNNKKKKKIPYDLIVLEFMRRHLKKHGPSKQSLRPIPGNYDEPDEEVIEEEDEGEEEEKKIQVVHRENMIDMKKRRKLSWEEELMMECWMTKSSKRPRFKTIVRVLKDKMEKVARKGRE